MGSITGQSKNLYDKKGKHKYYKTTFITNIANNLTNILQGGDKVEDNSNNVCMTSEPNLEQDNKKRKKKPMNSARRAELIFYYSFIALPILQVLIFYFGVNINSILLSFKEYTFNGQYMEASFVGFDNFAKFFKAIAAGDYWQMITNSLIFYAVSLGIGVSLALFFSFYVYKKFFMSEFFRVMLFLPSIISSMVLITMYKILIGGAASEIGRAFGDEFFIFDRPERRMLIMIIYNTIIGFGTSTIMYTNAMSRIPVSVSEYARIDGVKPMREFFSLTLPMIFPTISTFIIVGVASIFVNQANLHAMYGSNAAELSTLGYDIYLDSIATVNPELNYPYASTRGIVYTLIACPLTILVKKLLDKIDPDVQY